MAEGVMYQIFPRSWAGERGATTFEDLIDGVDYLADLGVDAVWLTPVVPAESVDKLYGNNNDSGFQEGPPGGGPHGYDTNDYFGIAEDLVPDGMNPIEAYAAFVDACHEQDIKVVFDLVSNHAGRGHDYFQDTIAEQGSKPPAPSWEYPPVEAWNEDSKHFDWWDRLEAPITHDGETVEPAPSPTGFWGLRVMPNWNYDNVAVREHMLAVAEFWSGEVGVDGFRCDIAWGSPTVSGRRSARSFGRTIASSSCSTRRSRRIPPSRRTSSTCTSTPRGSRRRPTTLPADWPRPPTSTTTYGRERRRGSRTTRSCSTPPRTTTSCACSTRP
ncbi:alpha-amylase family glycosyl hydrolase [Saliphagus sp. GCM10025308]